MTRYKRCTRCRLVKLAKDFYKDLRCKGKLPSYCKQCHNKIVSQGRVTARMRTRFEVLDYFSQPLD